MSEKFRVISEAKQNSLEFIEVVLLGGNVMFIRHLF